MHIELLLLMHKLIELYGAYSLKKFTGAKAVYRRWVIAAKYGHYHAPLFSATAEPPI